MGTLICSGYGDIGLGEANLQFIWMLLLWPLLLLLPPLLLQVLCGYAHLVRLW